MIVRRKRNTVRLAQGALTQSLIDIRGKTDVSMINRAVWSISEINNFTHVAGVEKSGGSMYWNKQCRKDSELRFIIMPYTFPLLIEFNVMASTMALAIWDNCGHGLKVRLEDRDGGDEERRRQIARRVRKMSVTTIQLDMLGLDSGEDSSVFDASTDSVSGKYKQNKHQYNKKAGFICGWIISVIVGMVLVIVCLYIMYSVDGIVITIEHAIYGSNLALSALCLAIIPFAFKRMSALTYRDDEIKLMLELKHESISQFKRNTRHKLDNYLLIVTLLASFAFKIFSAIAAIEQEAYLVLADSVVCMITALVQTFFIMWAQNKRSKTEEHLEQRPGKQELEFLRCLNFAMWLVNTFLLKHPEAKRVQNLTYEYLPWSILSNTFQPLTILFYFHTVVYIAEVLRRAYTDKFVGMIRPSKRKMTSATMRSTPAEFLVGSDL